MKFLRVFVIEDSPLLRDRITEVIAHQPSMLVIGTASGEDDAIRQINDLKPGAVVVDIKLAQGNGLNVVAAIRASSDGEQPKVVVFTNYPRREYMRAASNMGADYFLDKSTQFSELPKILSGFVVHQSDAV